MPTIAYIHPAPWALGGASRSLYLLLKHLDRGRFRPLVYLPDEGPCRALFESLDVPVKVVPQGLFMHSADGYRWYEILALARLPAGMTEATRLVLELKSARVDLVHLNAAPLIPAAKAAKTAQLPLVWHLREVLPRGYWGLRRNYVIGNLCRLADRIICISEDHFNQLPPGAPAQVIYNSVDFDEIDASAARTMVARSRHGLEDGARYVGYIGYVGAAKGVFTFLEAAAEVCRSLPELPIRFLIIGHQGLRLRRYLPHQIIGIGPEFPYHRALRLTKELGLQDRVTFTGYVEDIYPLMRNLDVVVNPSHYQSIERPALEGQALGLPVVAANLGRASGIMRHDQTGLVVPPGDAAALAGAMIELLKDPELARRLAGAGATHAREAFDARKNARRIEQVYDEILQPS